MRKSFDGLYGIIKNDFQGNTADGGLFIFLSQCRNRIKLLHWGTDGIAISIAKFCERLRQSRVSAAPATECKIDTFAIG